jgi:hypothetical protein
MAQMSGWIIKRTDCLTEDEQWASDPLQATVFPTLHDALNKRGGLGGTHKNMPIIDLNKPRDRKSGVYFKEVQSR